MSTSRSPLILISAMTRGRVIGKAGALPWSIPDEYEHFLEQVRGNPVIFGRTSWEIFGEDLGSSPIFVVSRSMEPTSGVEVCRDVPSAVERARSVGRRVFSAGGATIYRQTLPLADAMYLSIVREDHDGDTRFPEWDDNEWELVRRADHPLWEFRVYERRSRPGS